MAAAGSGKCSKVSKLVTRSNLPFGRRCVLGHQGIEGQGDRKAGVSKHGTKCAIAAAIIEDAGFRLDRSPQPRHGVGIGARTVGDILVIDQLVVVIVNVGPELLDAPIVKGIGEDKFAFRATAVIDRHARQREQNRPPIFARSIEIDDAEQRSLAAADFARAWRRRHWPEASDHGRRIKRNQLAYATSIQWLINAPAGRRPAR